jgi:hypothetical protein
MRHLGSVGILVWLAACGGGDSPSPRAHSPAQGDAEALPPAACVPAIAAVEEVSAPPDRTAFDVAATPRSIVVGAFGAAVASIDGGASWAPLPFWAKRVEADAAGYVALDTKGAVWLGDAEAARWHEASKGLNGLVVEHVARGGGISLAIAGGLAHHWSGEEWLPLEPTGTAPVERVATDGGSFLATDFTGLFTSTDGATWEKVPIDTAWAYRGLSVAGARRLASSFVLFARSDDGGLSWSIDEETHATIGVAEEILDDGPLTLAAGQKGVFSSADGGFTWSPVPGTGASATAVGLARHGESYLAASRGLYRNDGVDWRLEERLGTRYVRGLFAVGDALFVASLDPHAYRAIDDGQWEAMDVDPIVVAVEHGGSTFAVTSGIYGTDLVRSDDGGASWTALPPAAGTPSARMGSLLSLGETLLIGSTSTETSSPGIGVHYSNDGGLTWSQANGLPMWGYHDANTTTHPPVTLLFAVGEVAYAVLDGVGLYRSHDRGATWSLAASDESALDRVAVLSDGVAVLGTTRDEGRLLRIESGAIVTLEAEGLPDGYRVADLVADGPLLVASLVDDDGLYLSDDGGDTFTSHPFGDARAMALVDGALWVAVEGVGLRRISLSCE